MSSQQELSAKDELVQTLTDLLTSVKEMPEEDKFRIIIESIILSH